MRRLVCLVLASTLVWPARAHADDEGADLLLTALLAPLVLPFGSLVVAAPFYGLSAWRGGTWMMEPRPLGGAARMQGLDPWGNGDRFALHLDFGGYPPKGGSLGWEGRFDVLWLGPSDTAEMRWDGLSLWRVSDPSANEVLEVLGGVSVAPRPRGGSDLSMDWTGGGLAGVRCGVMTGGLHLLRLEGEVLGVALAGSGGLETRVELRGSAAVHLPFHPLLAPEQTSEIGLGLAWRSILPMGRERTLPTVHFLMWSLSF